MLDIGATESASQIFDIFFSKAHSSTHRKVVRVDPKYDFPIPMDLDTQKMVFAYVSVFVHLIFPMILSVYMLIIVYRSKYHGIGILAATFYLVTYYQIALW
jgi:hypothetical protein